MTIASGGQAECEAIFGPEGNVLHLCAGTLRIAEPRLQAVMQIGPATHQEHGPRADSTLQVRIVLQRCGIAHVAAVQVGRAARQPENELGTLKERTPLVRRQQNCRQRQTPDACQNTSCRRG